MVGDTNLQSKSRTKKVKTEIDPAAQSAQTPEEFFQNQALLINEFVDTIRTQKLEQLFRLGETTTIKLDGKTYHRKGITARQNQELTELDTAITTIDNVVERNKKLIELRFKEGEYYFGIPEDVVDLHYEELEELLDACLLRTYTGIKSSSKEIGKLLDMFKKKYEKSSLMANPLPK